MDFSHLDATSWATIWATISLVIFLGVTVYFGLPKAIAKLLDTRIAKIQSDLDDAKRLRAEAEALLAGYESKRLAAEGEAASIVTAAQEEAKRLTADAAVALTALIARRTKSVEDKIAQAESSAIAEVRARSADLAIEAARALLTKQMAEKGDTIVAQSIKDVASRLN